MSSDDLDRLMNEDPLKLADPDIDAIIAYERKMRQAWVAGVKPTKEAKAPTIDIESVMAVMGGESPDEPAKPKLTRRI